MTGWELDPQFAAKSGFRMKRRSDCLKAAAKLRAIQAVKACPRGVKCGVGVLVCVDLSSQVIPSGSRLDLAARSMAHLSTLLADENAGLESLDSRPF